MTDDQLLYIKAHLDEYNEMLRDKGPEHIIRFILSSSKRPILTSNFGPYSASLIHAVSKQRNGIPLIWCDTGFNTKQTVNFAKRIEESLPIDLKRYQPRKRYSEDELPSESGEAFQNFVNDVKLEPFKRALAEHNPDVWFTNIRRGQTAYRDTLDILSLTSDGILKVSPFYFWTDTELRGYLSQFNLPNEFIYFDPTKPKSNLECGIQFK